MWFELPPSPAAVGLYDFWTIERDALERVDSNEDYSAVCVDTVLGVAVADGMQDWDVLDEGVGRHEATHRRARSGGTGSPNHQLFRAGGDCAGEEGLLCPP